MTKLLATTFIDTLLKTVSQFYSSDYNFTSEHGFRSISGTYAYSEEEQHLRFLKEGDRVKYQFRGSLNTEPENGIVQFVGYTEAKGELVAGIKFENYIYKYGKTGCVNGVTRFNCQFGHGVFLPVKDILEQNPEFQQIRELQLLKLGAMIKYQIPDALHLNPAVGKIRSFGSGADTGWELMAGVEFDNDVGQRRHRKARIEYISVNTILDQNPEFQISAEDFPENSVNITKDSLPSQNLTPEEVNKDRHGRGATDMSTKRIAEVQNTLSL